MQVSTYVDVDVVAVEQDDEVSVMLELVAPAPQPGERRPPAAVQVVLDRSGSMAGERLGAAQEALVRLVDRLDAADRFGLVAFDDEVTVVVPAGPLMDRQWARSAIAALAPGGSTNLSAGLLRGLQEARRVAAGAGSTLLLLSDGHANGGETDPARLAAVAAGGRDGGVTISTVGIGLGYDELLMSEVARGGQGNHVFAEQADGAAAAIAGEVEGLLSKTVQAVSLIVRPDAAVDSVTVWNDVPGHAVESGVMLELGDLWASEERRLVLTLAVPARASLGLARVAELELRYVSVPELVERTVTIPVHVNVVPGDQAAGRIPDPKVRTEVVYQQVQDAKRRASEALRDGDVDAAKAAYSAAGEQIEELLAAAPSAELAEERAVVDRLLDRSSGGDVAWAAKFGSMDHSRKSRTRGRPATPGLEDAHEQEQDEGHGG